MSVEKGDRVIWRGRRSKVMAVRASGLTLHVGEGQIVRDVGVRDYTVIPDPEPEPTTQPSEAKPIAKARRKVSTGKGK